MMLKSIRLENIRSYIDQTIEFPMGTTLFEGDIGAGKSTILMAIEFALFGLGSERGGSLLRVGASKGSVTLKFEVDGDEYEVYRCLERRKKGIQQSDCHIKTKDGILHLSPSEMKERILEILKFNEPPDPKAQSVIYRYAVFTPQEEMKAILWMNPDSRLQTLRRAFRIEDYRTAVGNASLLSKLVNERSIELSSRASDLEAKQEACRCKEAEVAVCETDLTSLTKAAGEIEDELTRLKERHSELQRRKDALGKAIGEIPLLAKQIQEKEDEIAALRFEVEKLSAEINQNLQPAIDQLRRIEKPIDRSEEALKKELDELRARERELRKVEASIEVKIGDYESIERSGICPTCDRPADPEEFKEKVEHKKEALSMVSEELSKYERRIEEIERLLKSLGDYGRAQEKLQSLSEQAERRLEQIDKANAKVVALTEQGEEAKRKLEKARGEVEELALVSSELEGFAREMERAQLELRAVEREISNKKAKIEMLRREVGELKREIENKERERRLAEKLKEYDIWIKEFFMPTVEIIEKHAMLSINQEFDQQLRKWWSLLVEDPGKECRVDEDFTPIVEQDGYEQDIYYLSGGEKTSLALAYRLALNNIVQRVSTSIGSNLLILDEPTDGFSREQVFKIREILDEINCPQVIIVSHERELEGFADRVFRVEKRDGVSEVKTT